MGFDYRGFLEFTRTAFFRTRNTDYPLTPRRVSRLAAFYLSFPLFELVTQIGLLLDDTFFADYRQQQVRQPVFIIGNPRSGTTFLHRLMAKDEAQFISLKTWQVLLAPSITQRRLWKTINNLDRRLGRSLKRLVQRWEKNWHDAFVVHELALEEPEEDEFLFVHIWSSLATSLFSAVMDRAPTYTHFDTAVPDAEKQRIMTFYQGCLKRHLYDQNGTPSQGKRYLAKNPSFCAKVGTLWQWFPDAKFIYLVRNPLEMIPSYVSVMQLQWRALADPLTPWAARDYVLHMARHWYTYPLQRLARAPADSYVIVRYDDLVHNPAGTVAGIYQHLGIEMNPVYAQVLLQEAEASKAYRSRHHYSLEQLGLTRELIVDRFRDVFDRFGFSTQVF